MSAPELEGSAASGRGNIRRALLLRVISAFVLMPTVILATHFGGRWFSALVAFAAMLMVFEWTRMVETRAYSWRFLVLASAAFAAMMLAGSGNYEYAFLVAGVGGLACLAPVGGFAFWPSIAAAYIIAPSAALIWLRFDPAYGRDLTYLIFATVWAADTGAFVFGKLIGGPKISYALSPSKTWAGIAGGVVGGALIGAVSAAVLWGADAAGPFFLTGGFLGAASVAGDLAESAFKRRFGVKDISGLIPGHGGVLDRLDGMIFATVIMTGVYLVFKVFETL